MLIVSFAFYNFTYSFSFFIVVHTLAYASCAYHEKNNTSPTIYKANTRPRTYPSREAPLTWRRMADVLNCLAMTLRIAVCPEPQGSRSHITVDIPGCALITT
jgi:hypothetical protein